MIYQFKPYTELMKNEKQTIEFLKKRLQNRS